MQHIHCPVSYLANAVGFPSTVTCTVYVSACLSPKILLLCIQEAGLHSLWTKPSKASQTEQTSTKSYVGPVQGVTLQVSLTFSDGIRLYAKLNCVYSLKLTLPSCKS